jgi:hypothetical protein
MTTVIGATLKDRYWIEAEVSRSGTVAARHADRPYLERNAKRAQL